MAEYGTEQTVIVNQTTGCVHAFTRYAIDLSCGCRCWSSRLFEAFSEQNGLPVQFHHGVSEDIVRPNEVYLMLNSQHDAGLLEFSRIASRLSLTIGKDISVISYNDSPINEIILNGLTAVSTDFKQMGELAAQMILDRNLSKTKCDFRLIRRATF